MSNEAQSLPTHTIIDGIRYRLVPVLVWRIITIAGIFIYVTLLVLFGAHVVIPWLVQRGAL